MRRLSKKQLKKLAVGLGVGLSITGAGAGIYSQSKNTLTVPNKAMAAEQVKLGTDGIFEKGKDISFDVDYQVSADSNMDKLELFDKLEPCYIYSKATLYDDKGNDVTDQGTLDFDKATNRISWLAKAGTADKWFARKMKMRIVVKLDENADLSKYLDKNTNQYNIPNVAHMQVNDKDIASNKVEVHTPNDKEPTIFKSVEDKNGKYVDTAKYQIGDEIHYRAQYFIPKNGKDISNVEFSDDLEDVLDFKDVKVTDDKGNDITKNSGDLKVDNEKESFAWQPTKDYLSKMPDHSFIVDITAKIKPNADLSKYLDKASEQYKIPNVAHMSYNNKDIPSNRVDVVTPPPDKKNTVVKSVAGLSGNYHEDKDNVEIGKDFTYKVKYTPAQGKTLKNVEFSDDLEDVLDIQKVVVKNPDGKDVTDSDGKIKIDNEKESFVWQPNDNVVADMGGKTFTVEITAKIKPNADLQKYLKNNTIEIPNTAHMRDSGEDTASNTPIVTPKTTEPTAKKGIVRDPSNWTKYFGNKTMTSASQETETSDKVSKAIEGNADDPKIKEAKSKVKQNADGSYQKANSSVSDKEFKDALDVLSRPYKAANPVKVNEQGSEPSTKVPTSADDLKAIINTTTVDNNKAARGDAVYYLLTYDTGNNFDIKSLIVSDDLQDVLDFKNVVILDADGTNITNDGNLVINDTDESWTWTAKEPAKYSGKKLYAAVAANIKLNADLSSYSDHKIPNVGHLQINGKDTPTNEVKTELNGPSNPKDDPRNPASPNNPNNPNSPNSILHGDGSKNGLTGKNGLLPRTGHFVLSHVGLIISSLLAVASGVAYYLYKKNKGVKSKVKNIFKK
ncbi:fimbrial isopeptide formation D2 domain-containing protein [Lactobacillus bombicola]|uniref:Fimbrial isopeptide formation D2 domain-containing protein n=1 Tax=Lactobacillus bombicola TaxID=1505723 RepID=A0A1I1TU48_9LACO|nr:isopeptide-forming domain-containing fimbrial protein [Lactobacillus bombicola]SFD62059.1 fimbrial isopeptide formation D2 domain-containing protein [Lactobacillus bombicola]